MACDDLKMFPYNSILFFRYVSGIQEGIQKESPQRRSLDYFLLNKNHMETTKLPYHAPNPNSHAFEDQRTDSDHAVRALIPNGGFFWWFNGGGFGNPILAGEHQTHCWRYLDVPLEVRING